MVPINSMVTIVPTYGPDPVVRYNGYPAADVIGDSPRVLSSAQVIAKLTEIAERVLPRGIELEWTDLSYQQVIQSNAAPIVFLLAVILVFLVLASLYESWTLPLAVILIVPLSMCSALFGVWLTGGDNNIFVQLDWSCSWGLLARTRSSSSSSFASWKFRAKESSKRP
jgi:multidrug efflux pump